MKIRILLFILVFVPLIGVGQTMGQSQKPSTIIYYIPQFERINLIQSGNLTHPYIANLTNIFDVVYELTVVLHFTDSKYIIEDFGGDSALPNGLNIFYNSSSLFNNYNVTSNDDLDQFFDDYRHQQDELGVPEHQIVATYAFSPSLIINTDYTLRFYVQDDITSLTTVDEFFVRIQGWDILEEQIFNPGNSREDPLGIFFKFFWRGNGLTLEGLVISLLGFAIVVVFWRKRS